MGVAAADLQAGRQPGGGHLVGERLQLGDAGQRVALGVRLVGPQDAQRAPHVGQRLPARLGDLQHRGGGPVRGPVLRVDGGVGERDHDGQVVGDDVVHLAGDPGPLLGDGQQRLLLLVQRQPFGPLLHGGEVGPAGPHVHPEDGGGDHRRGERDERGQERAVRCPAQAGQHGAALHDGGGEQRAAPARVRGRRVQGHQQGDVPRQLDVRQPLDEGRGHHGGEHSERGPAPPHQGQRQGGGERRRHRQLPGRVRGHDVEQEQRRQYRVPHQGRYPVPVAHRHTSPPIGRRGGPTGAATA